MKSSVVPRMLVIGGLVATTALTGSASPASASAMPATQLPAVRIDCDSSTYLVITRHQRYWMGKGIVFEDGPGGTMTASVSRSSTLSATATGSAETEVGAIVAKAKVSVSMSLTGAVTIEQGHSYTHEIPSHKYGHLQYGSWGQRIWWQDRHIDRQCRVTVTRRGTAKIPTNSVGWHFWATK